MAASEPIIHIPDDEEIALEIAQHRASAEEFDADDLAQLVSETDQRYESSNGDIAVLLEALSRKSKESAQRTRHINKFLRAAQLIKEYWHDWCHSKGLQPRASRPGKEFFAWAGEKARIARANAKRLDQVNGPRTTQRHFRRPAGAGPTPEQRATEGTIGTLQVRLDAARHELHSLRSRVRTLEEELGQVTFQRDRLQREFDANRRIATGRGDAVSTLKEEVRKYKEESERYQRDLKQLNTTYTWALGELEKARAREHVAGSQGYKEGFNQGFQAGSQAVAQAGAFGKRPRQQTPEENSAFAAKRREAKQAKGAKEGAAESQP